MKAILIGPERSLIEEILGHLVGRERDYSANLVVFPGKRPSHFLRKAIAAREGGSYVPPRILSMEECIDALYEEELGLRDRRLEAIDAVALLYEIHRDAQVPARFGGSHFDRADRFLPLGLKIYQALEELCIAGVETRAVREIETLAEDRLGQGGLPGGARRGLQSLSDLYEMFYRRIREGGFSTRSLRYREVAERMEGVDLSRYQALIFAGFFALTPAERTICKFLLARPNAIFLFQEGAGMQERLKELGIVAPSPAPAREPDIHFYRSPDGHGQVFGVSTLLQGMLDAQGPIDERTAIVLPSPRSLFPLRHHALSLLEPEAYNISLGYPLQRTPLFGFFSNLTQLISTREGDRLYLPHYLSFVLHPYTKNIYFPGQERRVDLTRMLFHALEEALCRNRTKVFASLGEIEGDPDVADLIGRRMGEAEAGIGPQMAMDHLREIHQSTIKKMLSFRDVGDFAEKAGEVIGYLHENSTASLHPLFTPYCEAFLSALDILRNSLMKDLGLEEVTSYFHLLRRYAMGCYVPFPGTPLRGLQVLGFLETRSLRFDRVILLDANEGVLPDGSPEDSLLPYAARRILGLPTHLDREGIIAYHFDTLIRGAREVHLFYVESDKSEKSRFVERLLWERQKREGKAEAGEYVQGIEYRVNLRAREPQPLQKTEEVARFLRDFSFSASSLTTYLQCPLQFYYRYVLNLGEREEISEELEGRDIGNFVHRVLQEFFDRHRGALLSEGDLRAAELNRIVDRRFEERYGSDPVGRAYLLRHQVRRHLGRFLEEYQIPLVREHAIRILHLEKDLALHLDGFDLRARLDRVEERDGRIAILDYKTSAREDLLRINFQKLVVQDRGTWSPAIRSLQLPIYHVLYAQAFGETPERIDCLFLLLGKTTLAASKIEAPLFPNQGAFAGDYDAIREVLFGLLREVVDPNVPFRPASQAEACRLCEFASLCTAGQQGA